MITIHKYTYQFTLLLLFTLLYACAQIVQPNGGNIDTTPPSLKFAIPANNAVNVTGNKFELNFNEYINSNDASAQLLVSPPLNTPPELVLNNKKLIIKIKDTLRANTTYTFNFGNSISDITENNKTDDFKYTFATGTYIDSLKLTGNVTNALTQVAEKGVFVMLYDNATDSTPMKRKPNYFAKTNEAGNYSITNIKQGTYTLFALKDANNDLLYNQPAENIGFSNQLIEIKKDTAYTIQLFNEGNEKQYVKRNTSENGYIKLILNKPSKYIDVQRKDGKEVYTHTRKSTDNDTLELWHNNLTNDTTMLYISYNQKVDTFQVIDKNIVLEKITPQNSISDSLPIIYKINKPVKTKDRSGKGASGMQLQTNFSTGILDYGKVITLTTNNPIMSYDASKISMYYINDTIKKDTIKVKLMIDKIDDFNLKITNTLPSNKIVYLRCMPQSITDCIGNTNDTLRFAFKSNGADNYGNFKLTVVPKDVKAQYILSVFTKEGKLIQRSILRPNNLINSQYVLQYNNMLATDYTMQLIYDTDGNGKWTTGNYLAKQQPETIIQYTGKQITLRANWDTEQTWKLDK